jgi:osmotically inducible lipoprotein OsmB
MNRRSSLFILHRSAFILLFPTACSRQIAAVKTQQNNAFESIPTFFSQLISFRGIDFVSLTRETNLTLYGGIVVIQIVRKRNIISIFLVVIFLILTAAVDSSAHRRRYKHKHSKTKGAVIGGIIGGVGGALIGGKKGAVIGAGGGAGTGYLVQRHRNKRHRRNR